MRASLLLLLIAIAPQPHMAARPPAAPPGWSPEVGSALERFEAGDGVGATRLAEQIASASRDERVRRDAAAVQALVLLGSDTRKGWLDGRGLLLQLAAVDPALVERAEVRLALGVAQTQLGETASALSALRRAADAFAARGDARGHSDALAALAEAWRRHAEWELTPREFEVRRPASAEEARAVRRARIEAVLDEARRTPGPAAARVELVLARFLLEDDRTRHEALKRLAALADVTAETADAVEARPAAREAALALADEHARAGQWSEALRYYERAGSAERVADIRRPIVRIDGPRSFPPATPAPLRLTTRIVDRVRVDLRRIDLEAWLDLRRGSLEEDALPEDGSVVHAGAFTPTYDAPHGVWSAPDALGGVAPELPAGAYVLAVRGAAADGRELLEKRLVLVSAIEAHVLAGNRRAVVWVRDAAPCAAAAVESAGAAVSGPSERVEAVFRMHGAFVPLRLDVSDGAAAFALPGEALVLSDRRWTCLVRRGPHRALCRGVLGDARQTVPEAARAVVVAAPPDPRVGDDVSVFGVLRGIAPRAEETPGERYWIDVQDASERVCASAPFEPAPDGTFALRVPVADDWEASTMSLLVRHGARVIAHERGQRTLRVRPRSETPARAYAVVRPEWSAPDAPAPQVRLAARYPWGAPAPDRRGAVVLRAARLPVDDPAEEPLIAVPASIRAPLGPTGRSLTLAPLHLLALPPGPTLYKLEFNCIGPDGRTTSAAAEFVRAARPRTDWLLRSPRAATSADALYFTAGLLDPIGPPLEAELRVVVEGDDVGSERLRMFPVPGGFRSEPWQPPRPGRFRCTAVWSDASEELARRTHGFELPEPDPASTGGVVALRAAATRDDDPAAPAAVLTASGRTTQALLGVLHEAGEPIAAAVIEPFDGRTVRRLDVRGGGELSRDAAVVLLGVEGGELRTVRVAPAAAPVPPPEMVVRRSPGGAPVGDSVAVDVYVRRFDGAPAHATVVARLIDAEPSADQRWAQMVAGGPDASAPERLDLAPLDAELSDALCRGPARWLDSRATTAGFARFHVPLPSEPGARRLLLAAFCDDGTTATGSHLLDARGRPEFAIDVPASLTLGDTSLLSLTLRAAPGSMPVAARLAVAAQGLDVGPLRCVSSAGIELEHQGGATALRLPPGETVTLVATVEAAVAGEGRVRVEGEFDGARLARRAACRVFDVDGALPAEAVTISIRRSLVRLREIVEGGPVLADGSGGGSQPTWEREGVASDARFAPGELILVRDEVQASKPLGRFTWSQRIPACGSTFVEPVADLLEIGTRGRFELHTMRWEAEGLAPGRYVHEFVLTAVRPGVGALPRPRVESEGVEAGVLVEPSGLLIEVR